MSDQTEKKRFEKATFWALLGILATVILGVPAVYFAVHEKRPHISYEIVGESKVLDVHQPVKELEIRYRGEDTFEWLLSLSRGSVDNLKEIKAFFANSEKAKLFLSYMEKPELSEAELELLPATLRRHVLQPQLLEYFSEGQVAKRPPANLFDSYFVKIFVKKDGKEFILRRATLITLDELISYLEANQPSLKLKRLLSQENFFSLA